VDEPRTETHRVLKNSLTVIKGYLQLLERELAKAEPDPARQAMHLRRLHTAIATLEHAIERGLGPNTPG
jgi:hypothetical protein